MASENGHAHVVQCLLTHGVTVDAIAITSQSTALIFSASNENPDVTTLLLTAGAKPDLTNGYGNTALHAACTRGHTKVSTALVKQGGANVKLANHKGSTPLHMVCYGSAVSSDSAALAKLLLSSGADVNAKDKRGNTPLMVCCSSGRVDLIKILVEAGASTDDSDETGRKAPEIAEFYQQAETKKFLLSLSKA